MATDLYMCFFSFSRSLRAIISNNINKNSSPKCYAFVLWAPIILEQGTLYWYCCDTTGYCLQ